jgi:hypothetical protein
MGEYYDLRENAIKACVQKCQSELAQLAQGGDSQLKLLKEKTNMMRTFQQELDIEQIHRSRSVKAVNERCRAFL